MSNEPSAGPKSRTQLLPSENMLELKVLTESVYAEYQPKTGSEQRLADSLIRHYWLMQRAYYKAQKELQNLNKQKQKEQIGFESQKRQSEALEAKTRLTNARSLTLEIKLANRKSPEPQSHPPQPRSKSTNQYEPQLDTPETATAAS